MQDTKAKISIDGVILEAECLNSGNYRGDEASVELVTDKNEIAEFNLLVQKSDEELEKEMNDLVVSITQEMKDKFSANLQSSVFKVLGFDDKWGKLEVDHCNGRVSSINELVTSQVKEHIVKEVVEKACKLSSEEKKKLIAATHKEFRSQIDYKLRESVSREVESQLRVFVAGQVAELINGMALGIKKNVITHMAAKNRENRLKAAKR